MLCTIWYHLHNLKNVKNTHGRVLLLVKLKAEAYNFTKSMIFSWVFFTFFKLYKWYWIVQIVIYFMFSGVWSLAGVFSLEVMINTESKYIMPSTEHHWSIYCCIADTIPGSRGLYEGEAIEWNFTINWFVPFHKSFRLLNLNNSVATAQKTKFSIKDFFSKCDQISSFLQIWSHLLKKSLMKNFAFCAENSTFTG